ncbi:hypothetical protein [uncultured Limnobacter sp.]|uniref:hypothetical protein n=1 Tax=uncultured Limnobacter sp. TaxID=199681 RepID=UPI0032B2BA9C|tara:strand:+ start:1116 stop:1289 length:174 start_codon:yes stop_codon:yes gene_type:complete
MLDLVFDIAFRVVAVASIVAAVTPTPKDDSAVKHLRGVVDFLAFNFGHAKNESISID